MGGSFDPIHFGHLFTAAFLKEELGLDQVLLVPVALQPFKAEGPRASGYHRRRMVELAVAGDSGLVGEWCELARGGVSYTIDTLRDLRKRLTEEHIVLLLGSDLAGDFNSWMEAEKIPELCEVVFFKRGAEPDQRCSLAVPVIEISSTAVRDRARAGKSLRYWVPEPVAEYITAAGLYK